MVKDTKVQELVINKLTSDRYEAMKRAGLLNDNELYMVTDEQYVKTDDLIEALSVKQDNLIAGNGIDITNNVISSVTNWGNIGGNLVDQSDLMAVLNGKVDSNSIANVALTGDYSDLINTPTIPTLEWGNIDGNLVDQSDLMAVLNGKQDNLSEGSGIKITNNTVSTNGKVVQIVSDDPLVKEDGVVYFITETDGE